jgi:phage terminase small subunit
VSKSEKALTLKQAAFVEHLMTDARGNQTEAARLAGYSGEADVVKVTASQLMKHEGVRAAIAEKLTADREKMAEGGTLLDRVRELNGKALSLLAKAEANGDSKTALAALREVRGTLELLGKLTQDIPDPTSDPAVSAVRARMRRVFDDPHAARLISELMEKLLLEGPDHGHEPPR